MKRILLLLVTGLFTIGLSSQNLVVNPGFEDWTDATNPTSWTKVENVAQESTPANVHGGTYSAKHTGGTNDLAQTIAIEAEKTYNLSFWYKVSTGDGTDARIWAYWQDTDGTNLDDNADELRGPNNSYLPDGSEWLEYATQVTAPVAATHLFLEVRTYSGAVVYYDDFVLEEVVVTEEPADLFFSEYIEGSSNNKALEIYNPGAEAVDLASYRIAQANNGGGWQYYHEFPEGASIEPGDVWVVLNSQADPALFDPANADEFISFPSPVTHNGDDARAIIYVTATDTTYLDIIGTPDVDPGSGWDVAGETNATVNHTLIRKNEIVQGTDDWALSAGTDAANSQWIVHDVDYFVDLGRHGPDVTAPTVMFDPEDGAVDVAVNSNITLTFDEPLLGAGGVEITDPSGLVEFRETDANGTEVAFTATIGAEKDVITIDPDADLAAGAVYYVALKANVVEDEAGNAIDAVQGMTFTTVDPFAVIISITNPAGGEFYYPGQEVQIDWNSQNVGNITIYVSFDNGVTWEPIIENIDPSTGTVNYTIPSDSDATMEGKLRIAEATDLNFDGIFDDSEVFMIVPMLSIHEIQSNTESNGNSVYEDTICMVTGVVTFANGTNEYYLSDGLGDYSGLAVRDNQNTPSVGDSVVIVGTVEEYFSLTQMNSLLMYELIEGGKAVPAPVEVSTGAIDEPLEGVIVKISSTKVVTETDTYGETEVDDGSGSVLVAELYYEPTLNLGGTYDVTGPLTYSYSKWKINPRNAADVVEILSSEATVTSDVYTVDDTGEEISGITATEELAEFKSNITPVYGATFEVYESDGNTIASDLQTGYKLTVTSQDGSVTKTYNITLDPLSDDATVTSALYTIDDGAGTIAGVLFKSSVDMFETYLTPAAGASFMTYAADGTTEATDLQTGYKLIVTAEDGITQKTYTITMDDAMPGGLIFSEYIEGSGNNKALEIFNPNDEPVKLNYYQISQISNGGDDWEYFHEFPAGSILGSHETWVIITDQTDETLFAYANADEVLGFPSVVHFNGDDARGLVVVTGEDTTLVDIIGEIGPDPGSAWAVAGITDATAEHTLLRKGTVMGGNTDWASSAGTNADNSEWIVKDQNYFDSLGTHTLIAPEPSSVATLSELMVDGTAVSGFSAAQLTYFMELPAGTTNVPAVTATPTDENATLNIMDATDLTGDAAARTTSVEVTAEDGVTKKTYTIEFTVAVSAKNALFSSVRVYPIPAVNTLYLENTSDIRMLTVFDITGSVVLQKHNAGDDEVQLDVSSLDSGVYMIRMSKEASTGIVRFVKQ
jgi:hypothetical protein